MVGEPDAGFSSAPAKLDETYVTPAETHNPLEPHPTTAIWDGTTSILYDSTQGVVNASSELFLPCLLARSSGGSRPPTNRRRAGLLAHGRPAYVRRGGRRLVPADPLVHQIR